MPEPVSVSSSDYFSALTDAMSILGKDPRTVFLGQGMEKGTFMSETLRGVPLEKRIEMPVAEEMQMGIALGMAVAGAIPVTIYPRWNFLILAMNQLVNHVDKLALISGYRPAMIIRVGVGSKGRMDPGPQHVGDFSEAVMSMCQTVQVVRLRNAAAVLPAYRMALEIRSPTLLVEYADLYG